MFDHGWTPDRIRPIVDTVLAQFGPERTMFGSNFPVDKLYSDYRTVAEAYRQLVPAAWQGRVFRGTAEHFYRLRIPASA